MKPRLTDAVLRGLYHACDRAEAEMEGMMLKEMSEEDKREYRDLRRSQDWVLRMLTYRAEQKGVDWLELVR